MILVTGSSGFIGTKLLNYLSQKYGSENLILYSSKENFNYKTLVYNDFVLDASKLLRGIKVTILIHVGGFIPKSRDFVNNIEGSYKNIETTKILIDCLTGCLKKVVFFSTVDVYENTNIKIKESSKINPDTLYALSKFYCEKMLLNWGDKNSIDIKILRIGHVYGPGEQHFKKLIPEIMKKLIKDQQITLFGDGNDIRTFIFINDVCEAVIKAIDYNGRIKIFNITSDEGFSIKNIINKIISLSEKKVTVNHIHNIDKTRHLIFDNSLMRKYLYVPKISLDEGLKREFNYFKNNYE